MSMFAVSAAEDRQCCGPGCRSGVSAAEGHYDESYFTWQAKQAFKKAASRDWAAFFGISWPPNGTAASSLVSMKGRREQTVLDFGAGTAAILASMKGRYGVGKRIAVEFSPTARSYVLKHYSDIEVHQYPEQVTPGTVDLVFSTSVIEHVECPVQELRALRSALRPGGKIIIGVKNEGVEMWRGWAAENRDNHLWTWNSMLLGNTVRAAGFIVDGVFSSGRSRQATEAFVTNMQFGVKGHTFQYLWLHAHVPTPGEPWPQRGKHAVKFDPKKA